MAFLNASGNPVSMQATTIQIELPCEPAATVGAPNWLKVIQAVYQLTVALGTGNPVAIAAAIQALFAALMGG